MKAERIVSVVIAGRVQGVSYRAWMQVEARALGLSGFVRNRDDGCVEAVFGGSRAAVDQMVALCWAGPPGARVMDVGVTDGAALPPGPGFGIRRD